MDSTKFKGYRTLLLNLALAILGVLEAFNWAHFLDSREAGLVMSVVSTLNIILRTFTTTPAGLSFPRSPPYPPSPKDYPQLRPTKKKERIPRDPI